MSTKTAKDIFSATNFEASKSMSTARSENNRTVLNSIVVKSNDVTKSAICDAVIMTAFNFSNSVTLMQLKQLAEAASVRSDAKTYVVTHARDCFKQQHSKARAVVQKNFTLHNNVLTCNAEFLKVLRAESSIAQIKTICESLHQFIESSNKQETSKQQTTSKQASNKRQVSKQATNDK